MKHRPSCIGITFTALTILFAAAFANAEARAAEQIFGSREFATVSAADHTKWTRVLRDPNSDHGDAAHCRPAVMSCAPAEWTRLIESVRGLGRRGQLDAVNRFFNKAPYVSDARNYGTGDYWATPNQLLARGGDCEDYAIAKYLTLRALGLGGDEMRVVVLEDLDRAVTHAILIVYDGDRVWALDNQISGVTDTRHIRSYRALYSINESGWWFHAE